MVRGEGLRYYRRIREEGEIVMTKGEDARDVSEGNTIRYHIYDSQDDAVLFSVY